jgi:hypothetical protein
MNYKYVESTSKTLGYKGNEVGNLGYYITRNYVIYTSHPVLLQKSTLEG